MRISRLLTATACALTLIGGAIAAAGPAVAAVNYVALGDSYASGLGAGNYDSSSGSCYRSSNAYPSLWAGAHSPASFGFTACSGATTSDVVNNQLGPLNSSTSLVSVTIGGNDTGFSNVMQTCVIGSDSDCLSAVNSAENYANNVLPGNLRTMYAALRSKAPYAHFVHVGYPHLYIIVNYCAGLDNTKRTALNQAADVLDSVIGKAAGNAGVTFADVRSQFAGHELCSGDGWLHSVTWPIGESYHPTDLGQSSGYYPVFSTYAG